jgi:hypothetical protein
LKTAQEVKIMAPLPEYRLQPSNRNARDVVRQMLPQMDMDPEYQRAHVWTVEQRRELIKSWIMGVPIGAVIINLRDNEGWRKNYGSVYNTEGEPQIWAVVDGKQRIETARQWFASELRVPRAWFADHDVDALGSSTGMVSYQGLSLPRQRFQGNNFQLPVVESQLPTRQAEAELFLLVNGGGTGQDSETMQRARKLAGQ